MATHQETAPTSTHYPFSQSEVPKIYEEVYQSVGQSTVELLKTWQASFFTCSEENGASDHQYLEIGCGPGDLTRNHLLAVCPPTLKRLVSTDNSQAMVDHARTAHAHPKIGYRLLDISRDDDVSRFIAEEGRFQRVYSFLALHLIKDKAAALKNVERLLTPGGECLVIWKASINMQKRLHRALLESESWARYHDILSIVSSPLQCCGEPTASGCIHATTVLPEVPVLLAAFCGPAVSTTDATPRPPEVQRNQNCSTFHLRGVCAPWNAPYDADPPHLVFHWASQRHHTRTVTSPMISRNHYKKSQPHGSPCNGLGGTTAMARPNWSLVFAMQILSIVIRRAIDVQLVPIDPMTLRNDLFSLVKQTGIVPLTCELLKVAKENVPIEDYARAPDEFS
ncbi:hypothetical protein MTO96_034458 [Rhipicephalus appendiculatus]